MCQYNSVGVFIIVDTIFMIFNQAMWDIWDGRNTLQGGKKLGITFVTSHLLHIKWLSSVVSQAWDCQRHILWDIIFCNDKPIDLCDMGPRPILKGGCQLWTSSGSFYHPCLFLFNILLFMLKTSLPNVSFTQLTQILSSSNFTVNLVRFSNLAFVGQSDAFQGATLHNIAMTWLEPKNYSMLNHSITQCNWTEYRFVLAAKIMVHLVWCHKIYVNWRHVAPFFDRVLGPDRVCLWCPISPFKRGLVPKKWVRECCDSENGSVWGIFGDFSTLSPFGKVPIKLKCYRSSLLLLEEVAILICWLIWSSMLSRKGKNSVKKLWRLKDERGIRRLFTDGWHCEILSGKLGSRGRFWRFYPKQMKAV